MLIEAYVVNKIDDYSFECLVAINSFFTRKQIFSLCPLKEYHLNIDEILYKVIYIWKDPLDKYYVNYVGKIIFKHHRKIYVFNQGIEEIYKKIE